MSCRPPRTTVPPFGTWDNLPAANTTTYGAAFMKYDYNPRQPIRPGIQEGNPPGLLGRHEFGKRQWHRNLGTPIDFQRGQAHPRSGDHFGPHPASGNPISLRQPIR